MKREIDLTDESIFSAHHHSISIPKIVHRIPWNKKSQLWNLRTHKPYENNQNVKFYLSQELEDGDELRNDFQVFTGTVLTFNQTNRNGTLFTDSSEWFNDISWDNGTNTSYITRSISQTSVEFFDSTDNSLYVYQTLPSGVKFPNSHDTGIEEYYNFPTGRRRRIIENRIKKLHTYPRGKIRCTHCQSLTRVKPWLKNNMCPECANRYYKTYHKYKIEHHNGWMTRTERRRKELITSRKIIAGIPWNDFYDERLSIHYKIQKEINDGWHFGDKIVVKYRGFDYNRPGVNPWQPNGRIPQDYDEYFDNLTWKDALDNWLTLGKSLLQE